MQQTIACAPWETNQKEQKKKRGLRTPSVTISGFSAPSRPSSQPTATRTRDTGKLTGSSRTRSFREVTSITLEQFRFLRDGGPYINQTTGQEEHFAGHLFDPVVFDDSVKGSFEPEGQTGGLL